MLEVEDSPARERTKYAIHRQMREWKHLVQAHLGGCDKPSLAAHLEHHAASVSVQRSL
jgi:hypothetical protein